MRAGGPSSTMAKGEVPPLVLGVGSPNKASVSAGSIRGHICVIGRPRSTAANIADILAWAATLGAGTVAVDLDGSVSALLVERAAKGRMGDVDLRLLTPSSPMGIPVSLRPLSGLSNAPHTTPWKRIRAWVPQLLSTLAGVGPGTPDHERVAGWFLKVLDRIKEENPSMLTVQGLVSAVKTALSGEDVPLPPEAVPLLEEAMSDMAEDLRNAALSYGAPVDLRRLLDTPVRGEDADGVEGRSHLDLILLDHMTQVADRNSIITALLLEVFAWCRISGTQGRLMVIVPEVESPTTFISKRPFAQRLAARVLATSGGTGLLAVVVPSSTDDPSGLPRFGAILIEKGALERDGPKMEAILKDQGLAPSDWARLGMLSTDEWALAAGAGWSKWHRFSPDAEAVRERELDAQDLAIVLPDEVRDVFKRKPEEEEGEERDEEGDEAKEAARVARAVEDAEDLMSMTTGAKPKRSSRVHQEVQELLKRKLEEKERAKEAQKYELQEMDLVEGEEPSDLEVSSHRPRPLAEGVIDDHRDTETGAPGVELHADDLQMELAVLEAREREGRRAEGEDEESRDVVIDLDHMDASWETISPESALGAEPSEGKPSRKEWAEDDEEEEIIVELDEE